MIQSKTNNVSTNVSTTQDFISAALAVASTDFTLIRGQGQDWALCPKLGRVQARLAEPVVELEKQLMTDFKNQSLGLTEIAPQSEWDWLALAQHHGLATRLLDWSTNPLVALWFAVRDAAAADDNGKSEDGVVWVFNPTRDEYADPESTDPFKITRTTVFRPKHITRRIVAQAGWFTAHRLDEKKQQFTSLERIGRLKTSLSKITVVPESFAAIRSDLSRMGLSYSSMFPGLDGLC